MYDSNIHVLSSAKCCRWSSTQEDLVFLFFFFLRGGVLAKWLQFVQVDILICMLEGFSQAASMLSIAFSSAWHFSAVLIFPSNNRKQKNKVCLLNMFMVASWRDMSRGEGSRKVRAEETLRCVCVWAIGVLSVQAALLFSLSFFGCCGLFPH